MRPRKKGKPWIRTPSVLPTRFSKLCRQKLRIRNMARTPMPEWVYGGLLYGILRLLSTPIPGSDWPSSALTILRAFLRFSSHFAGIRPMKLIEVIRRSSRAWNAQALVNLLRKVPLMHLGAVSAIAVILAVAATAFEGENNNAPWYPSLQA